MDHRGFEIELVEFMDQKVHEPPFMVQDISSLDQIAAENLLFMAQEGQMEIVDLIQNVVQEEELQKQQQQQNEEFPCNEITTEEVITDDWVEQGEERVEIPVDQIITSQSNIDNNEFDVPLPTQQDYYTASRPYPCDFCTRRFRKKNSLMNHMVNFHAGGSEFDYLPLNDNHIVIPTGNLDRFYENEIGINFAPDTHAGMTTPPYISSRKSPSKKSSKKSKSFFKHEYEDSYTDYDIIGQIKIENDDLVDHKPLICLTCGISFTREKALQSHQKSHAISSTNLECKECAEVFYDLTSLQEHEKTNHNFDGSHSEYEPENDDDDSDYSDMDDKYGGYFCKHCGLSFPKKNFLKRHIKTHVKVEAHRALNKMIEKGEESPLCCNTCDETFTDPVELMAHAETHSRNVDYKCVFCGDSFSEGESIKKHLYDYHETFMTENSCVLCGKECRDRKALIKHSWDHSSNKDHLCSKCGKNFHNKARLKRHMSSHRDKSVTCDVCNQEFPNGRSLSNHRHSHTSITGKSFPCSTCGKTFGSRSSQQIHVRIHTGEKPYGCQFCYKAFADGGTLRKHERIHTGEKPYACAVCPRAFNQRVVLREHTRSHHSGLDKKRGTFFCPVCQADLPSSAELTKHLIQHSDLNTAKKRQPVTGPRKYKRRRKLKPHELEREERERLQNSDLEISDFEMAKVTMDDILGISSPNKNSTSTTISGVSDSLYSKPRTISNSSDRSIGWQSRFLANTTNHDDAYKFMISNPENTLQTLDTLVVQNHNNNNNKFFAGESTSSLDRKTKCSTSPLLEPSSSKSRPKMIHTQKQKRKLHHHQQPLITKPATELTDQMDLFSIHKSDFDVINPDPVLPAQISCSPIRGARDSFTESDVDVDFEQPPITDQRRSNRLRRSTVPNRKYLEFETNLTFGRSNYKNSATNKSGSSSGTSSKKKRDSSDFECEMCSKSFCDENELLTHVSVHI